MIDIDIKKLADDCGLLTPEVGVREGSYSQLKQFAEAYYVEKQRQLEPYAWESSQTGLLSFHKFNDNDLPLYTHHKTRGDYIKINQISATNALVATELARANEKFIDYSNALVSKAKAVINRWDSPDWKDGTHTADYIHALRKAVEDVTDQLPKFAELQKQVPNDDVYKDAERYRYLLNSKLVDWIDCYASPLITDVNERRKITNETIDAAMLVTAPKTPKWSE